MHTYIKHAGLSLAAVILVAGLSACKEEKAQKPDASPQTQQQQSRSDLKSGFGAGTADHMDTANTIDPTPGTAERIQEETTDAMLPASGDPSMEITTGSVGSADTPDRSDSGQEPALANAGDAVEEAKSKPLTEDEKFAAELAREAEEEEMETQAAKRGESK